MIKLIEGFNLDIENQDYHDDREYISSSGLKLILNDPKQFYKTYVEGVSQEFGNQNAMDFGSYIHALILEPHLVEKEFIVFEGAMRRGKEWEKFKEENQDNDKIVITSSQKRQADRLIENFEKAKAKLGDKDVKISSFFTDGYAEQTLCGTLDDVKVKVRFDYRKEFDEYGSINDIKTTSSPISGKGDAEEVCKTWGYDVSAALYCDMVAKYTDKKHDFYFVFLSKKDNETTIFKASEQMLASGRKKYKEALKLLKKARETGVYYEDKIEEIDAI